MKSHGRVVGGMGITGILQIKYYEDGEVWVWIVGQGSFWTNSERANKIYESYCRKVG